MEHAAWRAAKAEWVEVQFPRLVDAVAREFDEMLDRSGISVIPFDAAMRTRHSSLFAASEKAKVIRRS